MTAEIKRDSELLINETSRQLSTRFAESGVYEIKSSANSHKMKGSIAIMNQIKHEGSQALVGANFDEIGSYFNEAYLIKNLFKCISALHYLQSRVAFDYDNILDIGCGVGNFGIAYRTLIKFGRIHFIDKSRRQLAENRKINIANSEYIHGNILDKNLKWKNSLCLASYFLCEQQKNQFELFFRKFENEDNAQSLIAIDYPENIKTIENWARSKNYFIIQFDLTTETSNFIFNQTDDRFINTHAIFISKRGDF